MRTHSKENAASDAASVVLLGNRLSQVRLFPVMFLSLSNSSAINGDQTISCVVGRCAIPVEGNDGKSSPKFGLGSGI